MALIQFATSIGTAAFAGGTYTLSITGTTAGTCGIVGVMWRSSTQTLTSVTDNQSGGTQTYTQAGPTITTAATAYSGAMFICPNNSSGVTQITLNSTGTGSPLIMGYAEESNIASSFPLDATAVPVGTGFTTTPWTSGNMASSTSANLTMYSFAFTKSSSASGFASSGSWAACGTHIPQTADGDDGWMQRQVVTSTGVYAGTGTTTTNMTGGAIVLALQQIQSSSPLPSGSRQTFVNEIVIQY
jgi:hypothetical protein